MAAVCVDCGDDAGVFAGYLPGLVAYVCRCARRGGLQVAAGLAFVAPAQYCRVVLGAEQAYEVFDVGSLACAACGDVAYVDDGQRVAAAFYYADVKEVVPDTHTEGVKPCQWHQ